MARSIASAIGGSMVTLRGAMRTSSIVARSNRSICSRTYASPRARTPAIASSATRSASASLALRRASMARRAASASEESALYIAGFLDPRNQRADPFSVRSIGVSADDQAWRDLGDQILDLELVDAYGLPGLDEIDDVRGQIENRRKLDRSRKRDDLRTKLPGLQILARDARILCGDF